MANYFENWKSNINFRNILILPSTIIPNIWRIIEMLIFIFIQKVLSFVIKQKFFQTILKIPFKRTSILKTIFFNCNWAQERLNCCNNFETKLLLLETGVSHLFPRIRVPTLIWYRKKQVHYSWTNCKCKIRAGFLNIFQVAFQNCNCHFEFRWNTWVKNYQHLGCQFYQHFS